MGLSLAGATALSAGMNFLGGLMTNNQSAQYNAEEAQKDRDFQERMYNQQVQDNINFWKMQNEYNLPSAVFERQLNGMRQNGLNPLLMYGEGGISNIGTAQQAPESAKAPSGAQGKSHFNNPIDLPNLALVQAQYDNIKADSDLKEAQEIAEMSKARNYDADSRAKLGSRLVSDRDAMLKKQEYDRGERTFEDDVKLKRAQREYQEGLNKMLPAQLEELKQKVNVLSATYDQIYSQINNQTRLTDQQIKKLQNDINNANKITAETVVLLSAQAREARANAYKVELDNWIHSQPEYKQQQLQLMSQNLLNAVRYGNQLEVENALKEYTLELLPSPGTAAYDAIRTAKNAQPVFQMLYGGYNVISGRDVLGSAGGLLKVF